MTQSLCVCARARMRVWLHINFQPVKVNLLLAFTFNSKISIHCVHWLVSFYDSIECGSSSPLQEYILTFKLLKLKWSITMYSNFQFDFPKPNPNYPIYGKALPSFKYFFFFLCPVFKLPVQILILNNKRNVKTSHFPKFPGSKSIPPVLFRKFRVSSNRHHTSQIEQNAKKTNNQTTNSINVFTNRVSNRKKIKRRTICRF